MQLKFILEYKLDTKQYTIVIDAVVVNRYSKKQKARWHRFLRPQSYFKRKREKDMSYYYMPETEKRIAKTRQILKNNNLDARVDLL